MSPEKTKEYRSLESQNHTRTDKNDSQKKWRNEIDKKKLAKIKE